MAITHLDNGITVLSGFMVDQSALYGVLEKIHHLNLTLISFQKVDFRESEDGDSEHENS